ncbi:MAG: quinolinate synthase NadA [Chloroflexota bacterium]
MFLGLWLERVTGRRLTIWSGECHVHAGIRPDDIDRMTADDPAAQLLVHPECGCASQAMAFANERTHILSTEGMIAHARRADTPARYRVATETGILYGLRRQVPDATFEPVREDAVCRFMKMIRSRSCETRCVTCDTVRVPEALAARARGAIERMVAIG